MHGHAVRDLAVTGIALQAKRIVVSKSPESSPQRNYAVAYQQTYLPGQSRFPGRQHW